MMAATETETREELGVAVAASLLADLGIDDETIADYLVGICLEETIPEDEKRESLIEFLSESTDKPVEEWLDALLARCVRLAEREKQAEEAERARVLESQKEREQAVLKETTVPVQQRRLDGNTASMTKEEKRAREKLLAQYGYDLDEIVERADGETEIVYKDSSDKGPSVDGSGLFMKNRNADIVKEQEQAKRYPAGNGHLRVADHRW
ncbi:hypothetical protein BC831DRAFT_473236 [Entophlyctis helioformis]|nr:hypothetical protein BC831DRAFT_473236 [Entophlyctis helioformis]